MAEKEFDPDDPMALVGVAVPEGNTEEMAECLVEEFVRMGFDDGQLHTLFRDPFYSIPHAIYAKTGEEYVKALIERVRERWRMGQR